MITHKDLAQLTTAAKPFSRQCWIFELKYDGFRVLGRKHGRVRELFSRRGNDMIDRFPEIERAMDALPDMVFDGELVILDTEGRPLFEELGRRNMMRSHKAIAPASVEMPAAIFVFDLLSLKGRDVRAKPLLARKKLLQDALKGSERVRYLAHIGEDGERLFKAADELQLEGIVAKRADAPYPRGRSHDWVKIKTAHGRHVDAERAKWNER